MRPTVAEIGRRGIDFRGVLYAGLMLTQGRAQGARVQLPFRRPRDPGAPAAAARATCWNCCGRPPRAASCRRPRSGGPGAAVGVVMASRGYPASASKGDVITGLERVRGLPARCEVFHAATKATVDGAVVTSGGRVLTVTGLGRYVCRGAAPGRTREWREITFEGEQHRSDIALRAEKWEAERRRRRRAGPAGTRGGRDERAAAGGDPDGVPVGRGGHGSGGQGAGVARHPLRDERPLRPSRSGSGARVLAERRVPRSQGDHRRGGQSCRAARGWSPR